MAASVRYIITFVVLLSIGHVNAQDLTGQVYLLADEVLNDDCEVEAQCDCCGAHLAFQTKDTFALVVRCHSGDTFYSGSYDATPSRITLTYKQFAVSEVLDDDNKWKANEKKEATLKPERFVAEICDGRTVLKNPTNHHFKSGSRLDKEGEVEVIKELAASKALQMFD